MWIGVAIVGITLWRLAAAYLLPVTQDEAYYFDWARHLAWGYFDHPPAVALLGYGTRLVPTSALAARLGTLVAATLTLLVLANFYRRCGLEDARDLGLALILAATTLPGIAGGFLATPDTPLALCWALALHEALPALRGARRRWLSAGLAAGLGLLSKYTLVLIGPAWLWAILWADPKALRTPWPYLGALLAVLVCAPHILWNLEQDWLTLRFQFGHGFATATGALLDGLPATVPEPAMTLAERARSLGEYAIVQLGLWGGIAVLGVAVLVRRRERQNAGAAFAATFDRPARALLTAAALFPLGFFALVASFSAVEPNWPVLYLTAACPFAALAWRAWRPWALAASAGNVLLASLYVYHGATAGLPLPDRYNRLLRETHGFAALAAAVADLPGPVFAARYQTVAMLRFYQPGWNVGQWPGIRRPSEYLRGHIVRPPGKEEIAAAGGFWLLVENTRAPEIPGYRIRAQRQFVDCAGQPLQARDKGPWPCRRPLHLWRLCQYGLADAPP